MKTVLHESVPITKKDCLIVFNRQQKKFDFPIHFHNEFEINLLVNAQGATRIIGEHSNTISNIELVLVGPNLVHGWEDYTESSHASEITIQFHRDLFSLHILEKSVFKDIQKLLLNATKGILFSKITTENALQLIYEISKTNGIKAYINLVNLLELLSQDENCIILNKKNVYYLDIQNSQIEKMYDFIEINFNKKISLEEVAEHLNMTIISFSRLVKSKTGKTFVNFLNDYRINYACRLLLDSTKSIADIADECGFNNQANFNRIFKSKVRISPTEYRQQTLEALIIK
ncbi:MAG: HTH-type transcriptional regulator YesS [Bacteroidetes bacterium ADurb.Bin217]|nr:MAG: HTH-type transcriptional regulator YesS [Bacteroidetes bacterium ADurb.Bin217]